MVVEWIGALFYCDWLFRRVTDDVPLKAATVLMFTVTL